MAQTVYKRQLIGQQSGVQVNMPRDMSERLLPDSGDQSFAVVGRFSRGRIDKPFSVSKSRMTRYLGRPQSMRKSAANETYVQIFEAFATGAAAAVVSRVVSSNATNNWIVIKQGSNSGITTAANLSNMTDVVFAFKIADCINDGVYVTVSQGDESDEFSVIVREISLDSTGKETGNGEELYSFTGSVNVDKKDDFGSSYYIGDVAEKYYGDWVEVSVDGAATPDGVSFITAKSATVKSFTDSGEPSSENYQSAADALGRTNIPYRYILSEGSNTALVSALLNIAQKYNRIMVQEISGKLSPAAAITWKNNFSYDAQGGMYCLWLWSPLSRNDSTNATGKFVYGTVGQKIGFACARNSITNGFGLPALNQPIAGNGFYIQGTDLVQTYFPDDNELADLAKAHINPVLYVEYIDGSGFVWDDSLSGSKKNGISRLENAVEISQWIQDRFGRFANSLRQTPMADALNKAQRFAEDELQAMQASSWLVASNELNGAAYSYVIEPSSKDIDTLMITVNPSIDGVVRRIIISQNMYSRV